MRSFLRIVSEFNTQIRKSSRILGDILVPPLFNLIGGDTPTLIRISTISILAQCVDTNPYSVLAYRKDMMNAMLDLLQIESVRAQKQAPLKEPTVDEEPTTLDPKVAEFRRAALHLLGMLLKASVNESHAEEETLYRTTQMAPTIRLSPKASSKSSGSLARETVQRLTSTLGYVASTDVDSTVRFMANEILETLMS